MYLVLYFYCVFFTLCFYFYVFMFKFLQEFSAGEKHSIDSPRDWSSFSISRAGSTLPPCWHHAGSLPQSHSQGSPSEMREQYCLPCQQRRTQGCICGVSTLEKTVWSPLWSPTSQKPLWSYVPLCQGESGMSQLDFRLLGVMDAFDLQAKSLL